MLDSLSMGHCPAVGAGLQLQLLSWLWKLPSGKNLSKPEESLLHGVQFCGCMTTHTQVRMLSTLLGTVPLVQMHDKQL